VVTRILSLFVVARIIAMFRPASCANSKRTCRQIPQGAVTSLVMKPLPRAMIARYSKVLQPSEFAMTIADRSAQMVAPYDAFSTFEPAKIRPSGEIRAAPTWKPEQGA